jgi:chromosome partitioning protein
VLIDAPSRLDTIALAAIRVASLIVLPTAPNLVDLAAVKPTLELIESAEKLNATIAVLNNVDERAGLKRIDQARGTLVAFNVAVARTAISRLPEFSDAFDRGKGVTELRTGNKAAAQIGTLLIDFERHARRIGAIRIPKRNGAAREALQ